MGDDGDRVQIVAKLALDFLEEFMSALDTPLTGNLYVDGQEPLGPCLARS